MLAAFNGGFKLSDGVGGYFYDGRTVKPLRVGLAAAVISRDGMLSVVKWGREVRSTVNLQVVRENLPLLVDANQARTSARDTPSSWGIANGNLPTANRSALGQLADGSLVYAFGLERTAAQMAALMVHVGARTAMLLDMNKSWPGGFTYTHAGTQVSGRRILPSIWHQPSVYFQRFTKDFFVALSRQ